MDDEKRDIKINRGSVKGYIISIILRINSK